METKHGRRTAFGGCHFGQAGKGGPTEMRACAVKTSRGNASYNREEVLQPWNASRLPLQYLR